jgi:hypothetical protein
MNYNTKKKILAGIIVVTWPIWVLPALVTYIVFGTCLILYMAICDTLGVKYK